MGVRKTNIKTKPMKKDERTGRSAGRCISAPRMLKSAAVNAMLAAIALGLFLALGRRGGVAAKASAAPLGAIRLASDSAVYRDKKGGNASLLIAVSWDASALPSILERLEERGAKATFALSGSFVRENGALVKLIAERGHELALMAEQDAENRSAEELKAELERTSALIEGASGVKPRTVFAGGSDKLCRAANALGQTAVKGSIDLVCERGTASELILRAKGNISGGDIVVCAPTAAFSVAVSDILEYFCSAGLTAATVSGTIYD